MAGEQGESGVVERNGINVIAEGERHGKPSSLFWPWFAANVSVLSIPFGAYVVGFGLSLWQAVVMGLVGVVAGFALVGLVALAGKRGSAPTLTLSRAAFGVRGNIVPGVVSYVSLVGWETINVVIATKATATVTQRLVRTDVNSSEIIGFIAVVLITVAVGIFGHKVIVRLQTILSFVLGLMTLGYIALVWRHIDFTKLVLLRGGSWQQNLAAVVFVITALGIGFINLGADYSRYLPRSASSVGVVGWTTLGASAAPIVLVLLGIALTGSDAKLGSAIISDPVGAFVVLVPTWYLIPFLLVTLLGLTSAAYFGLYSSGLSLLSLGIPIQRWVAATIDGFLMTAATVAIVWFSPDVFDDLYAFLVTLGVPLAAWGGVFIADTLLRRRDYDEEALFDARGRYGSFNWLNLAVFLVFTLIGWGLISSDVAWLKWQGFLFGPLQLNASWQSTGIGVVVALVGAFVFALLGRGRVRREEAADEPLKA